MLEVVGRGSVTIFDGTRMVSNAHEARERRPILASGVVLHVLPAGAHFNLTTRTLVPSSPVIDPAESDELALANQDMRKLARDIAAGDVSPSVLRRRLARRNRGGQHD
jgi:cyanophycinase